MSTALGFLMPNAVAFVLYGCVLYVIIYSFILIVACPLMLLFLVFFGFAKSTLRKEYLIANIAINY